MLGLLVFPAMVLVLGGFALGLLALGPWVAYPVIVGFFVWLVVWAVRSDWMSDRYPNRME